MYSIEKANTPPLFFILLTHIHINELYILYLKLQEVIMKKTNQILIRVSEEEKETIKANAKLLNMTTTQFIIHSSTNHVTNILSHGKDILHELKLLNGKLNSLTQISPTEKLEIEEQIKCIINNEVV